MCATAANLIEHVLPSGVALRQWVLTFPFPWRRRLAQDGALLGALTRIFVGTVERFYGERAAKRPAKTGAVTVVQRSSSDLRLNPHLHVVFLDGTYHEPGDALAWDELGHLKTREVGNVLEGTVRRIDRYLRRHRLLELGGSNGDAEAALCASAVSGREPPAGPQWLRGLSPLAPSALAFDKPLCASLDGFTLHAATRAGGLDVAGREALLRYVLRPPVAQERVELRPDGLVRIALKRAYADGTIAVDMDPLSLLCRLATSVPTIPSDYPWSETPDRRGAPRAGDGHHADSPARGDEAQAGQYMARLPGRAPDGGGRSPGWRTNRTSHRLDGPGIAVGRAEDRGQGREALRPRTALAGPGGRDRTSPKTCPFAESFFSVG
jgi:hypothetical protein